MVAEERILSWNCRGAGDREFEVEMKYLLKEYRPQMIVLLEPRISGSTADLVSRKLGKKR